MLAWSTFALQAKVKYAVSIELLNKEKGQSKQRRESKDEVKSKSVATTKRAQLVEGKLKAKTSSQDGKQ